MRRVRAELSLCVRAFEGRGRIWPEEENMVMIDKLLVLLMFAGAFGAFFALGYLWYVLAHCYMLARERKLPAFVDWTDSGDDNL